MSNFKEIIEESNLKAGRQILYDKREASKENTVYLKQKSLLNGIMRKKPKGKPMRHLEKLRNKVISKKRFIVERTFGTMKENLWF